MSTFRAFPREYGPPGIRNHVLVVSGELSCNPWALRIASRASGCHAVTHKHGLLNVGPDRETFLRIVSGMMSHPNVAGAVLVTSGNEDYDPRELTRQVGERGREVSLISMTARKTAKTLVRKGVEMARRIADEAGRARRTEVDVAQLRVGLNCAGTDALSANTCHAVCGRAMETLIAEGGTVILSEVPDLIGLGEELLGRCETKDVRRRLRAAIRRQTRRLLSAEEDVSRSDLCRFNIAGGLSSLTEKAKVSVVKGGASPIREVVGYGQPPAKSGLVVMDGPAMTDFVMTGLMGAGAHMMVNCCGAGIASKMPALLGADSTSPILPVVKVTGSTRYFNQKENRIDFNAGTIQAHPERLQGKGQKLFELILNVASGKTARTEALQDFFVNFPMQFFQA